MQVLVKSAATSRFTLHIKSQYLQSFFLHSCYKHSLGIYHGSIMNRRWIYRSQQSKVVSWIQVLTDRINSKYIGRQTNNYEDKLHGKVGDRIKKRERRQADSRKIIERGLVFVHNHERKKQRCVATDRTWSSVGKAVQAPRFPAQRPEQAWGGAAERTHRAAQAVWGIFTLL